VLALLLAGCSSEANEQWARAGLPEPASDIGERIESLWRGSWIAAMIVGVLVWALILFSSVVHRRRAGETGLPPQVRYNLPVEVVYTVAPIVVVLVFFFFTARDQTEITRVSNEVDHTVGVVGKRWSWDFNYLDEKVFETGIPGDPRRSCCPWARRCSSPWTAVTSSTRSGCRRSSPSSTRSLGATTASSCGRRAPAPSSASAPSCAAPTTPAMLFDVRRGSTARSTTAYIESLRAKGRPVSCRPTTAQTRQLQKATRRRGVVRTAE
jgi:heme/copper-type cytochrome/quinol oxidase subunit 2